jgi:hypothetical protein
LLLVPTLDVELSTDIARLGGPRPEDILSLEVWELESLTIDDTLLDTLSNKRRGERGPDPGRGSMGQRQQLLEPLPDNRLTFAF